MTMNELLAEYSHDPQAQKVIRTLFTTTNSVFLTGCAGTGKTRLLGRIMETVRKTFILLAPNGFSAINSGGQTIHSFFRLPQRTFLPEDEEIPLDPELVLILGQTELIIIDDVSLVRADLMNAIDLSLKKHLDSSEPFAGIQLLLVGDLFQVPPSEDPTGLYPTKYFFGAPAFKNFKLWVIELAHSYRYPDSAFFEILQKIRNGRPDDTVIRKLNSRIQPGLLQNDESAGILLAMSNLTVDRINAEKYADLPGEEQLLPALETGAFTDYLQDSGCPAERLLKLKPDTHVVFIKDDPKGRWMAGTMGRVLGFNEDTLEILTGPEDNHLVVERESWSLWEYGWDPEKNCISKREAGTMTQFPVKPAWAVLAKGASSLVFEKMALDIGSGAFLHGQAYLAISRCTSLDQLTVRTFIQSEDFITDPAVISFMVSETSADKEGELWSSLLDHAGNELAQKISALQVQNSKLQESNAGLTGTLEAAKKELYADREKQRVMNEGLSGLRERILAYEKEKAAWSEDLQMLEKRVRKKDRSINFLLIIQLVFFLAALGLVLFKVL
ncbi:MAG: hypothetical protein A2X22_07720 [Bacteroidetes bacterium GWF2_49_14]|nr:MAG: hypothetical protein A2X22_07720 [Bacteroidetes bacterium GWF2_49_14]HBB92913.1 hypothetical protein [Bacteroidales bacterium]